jgi:catechol 2,3-dioxygenase-like lactoylglutathione lyase family enzyme
VAARRVRIGSVVFNCTDSATMRRFWGEALGYVRRDPAREADDGFTVLHDPAGRPPNLSIDRGEPERHPIHLDLYTPDHDGEVARLLALGATLYRRREPGEDFTVLADPEGNLFCVVDAPEG